MVSREDIFAAGRWLYNPCDKAYLTGLTPSFLLFTAGLVEPAKRNKLKYALPRATVQPPKELLDLVFPEAPARLAHVKKVCYVHTSSYVHTILLKTMLLCMHSFVYVNLIVLCFILVQAGQ
jgi:hypothetical protein